MKNAAYFMLVMLIPLMVSKAKAQSQTSNYQAFLQQAELDGINGTSLCAYAAIKVVDKQLKRFTIMAHNDYVEANHQLLQLAAKKKVGMPNLEMDKASLTALPVYDHKAYLTDPDQDRIKQIFDASLVRTLIEDYQNILGLYEKYADLKDPDVSAYIGQHIPVIKRNLQEAVRFTGQRMIAQQNVSE